MRLYWFSKIDGFVKSPPSRHSREGGSPEALEIPGFPFPASAGTSFTGMTGKGGFHDFSRMHQD